MISCGYFKTLTANKLDETPFRGPRSKVRLLRRVASFTDISKQV